MSSVLGLLDIIDEMIDMEYDLMDLLVSGYKPHIDEVERWRVAQERKKKTLVAFRKRVEEIEGYRD